MTTLTVVRVGLFALTIVALGFVPGVSVAKAPSKATGHGDFTPTTDNQVRAFSFGAIQQDNGRVAGQAELHNRATGDFVHIDIDCLRVVGNTAFVSGTVTKSSNTDMVPLESIVVFEAIDNGEGINSPPDRLSRLALADCNNPPNFEEINALFDIQLGNIQVRP
jgi:hypothetical protein